MLFYVPLFAELNRMGTTVVIATTTIITMTTTMMTMISNCSLPPRSMLRVERGGWTLTMIHGLLLQ